MTLAAMVQGDITVLVYKTNLRSRGIQLQGYRTYAPTVTTCCRSISIAT